MFENLSNLRTKKGKRIFFFVLLLLIVIEFAAYLLLHFKVQWFHPEVINVGKEVLADIIAATITSAVVAFLIFKLMPVEETLKSVEILDSSKTKHLHEWALRNTEYWFHIGHTARWVRLEAMKSLSNSSVKKGTNTYVKIVIFNPDNDSICQQYSGYRNRIAFREKGDNKSVDSIKADIIATIISSKFYNQKPCGLEVEVFLSDEFYVFREDISNKITFITQPDPSSPAIAMFNLDENISASKLYNGTKINFNLKTELLKKLDFSSTSQISNPPTKEEISRLLDELNISNVSEQVVLLALKRYSSTYHPYK